MLWLWACGWMAVASAGELAGVNLPDQATVGGSAMVLNGMGLREKYFIDVYVGGLYLPSKTTSSSEAVSVDASKRIVMHFLYKVVTADQLAETFREGFAIADPDGALSDKVDALCAMMSDVHSGDEIVLDYVPGTGTTVSVRGEVKGTVAGKGFMAALWSVYLGPKPPTEKLKRGMMGG